MQIWKKESVLSVSSQPKNRAAETIRHWQNLQILLLHSPLNSDFLLKQPPPVAPPPGFSITQLLQSCSSGKRRQLLTRHLLSSLVLSNEPSKELQAFSRINTVKEFFSETDHDTFTSAIWIAVPVPVIQGNSAAVLTLMLGLAAGKGRVLFQNMPGFDQSSRKALEIAFQSPFLNGIDQKNDLLVWTLQNEDSMPLKGTSLGLPAAIGLYLLLNRKKWPHGFFDEAADLSFELLKEISKRQN